LEIKYDDDIYGKRLTIENLRQNDGKFFMFDSLDEVFGIVEPLFEQEGNEDVKIEKRLTKVVLKVGIRL